jgi:hypothetical protein
MNKIVTIINQSLFDIAAQYYGSIEGVFDIIEDNPELELLLTSEVPPGTILKIRPVNNEIADYFKKEEKFIATATSPQSGGPYLIQPNGSYVITPQGGKILI